MVQTEKRRQTSDFEERERQGSDFEVEFDEGKIEFRLLRGEERV